jgi:hypothetical protein
VAKPIKRTNKKSRKDFVEAGDRGIRAAAAEVWRLSRMLAFASIP